VRECTYTQHKELDLIIPELVYRSSPLKRARATRGIHLSLLVRALGSMQPPPPPPGPVAWKSTSSASLPFYIRWSQFVKPLLYGLLFTRYKFIPNVCFEILLAHFDSTVAGLLYGIRMGIPLQTFLDHFRALWPLQNETRI
jgi:hypothetical protein